MKTATIKTKQLTTTFANNTIERSHDEWYRTQTSFCYLLQVPKFGSKIRTKIFYS